MRWARKLGARPCVPASGSGPARLAMKHRIQQRRRTLAAAAALVAASCAGDPGTPVGTSTLEASTMTHAATDTAPESALPALDLRAPAHLETATFALG